MNGEKGEPILHLVLTAGDDDTHEQAEHIACAAGSWKILDRKPDPASLLKGVDGIDFSDDAGLLDEFMSDPSSHFELTAEIVSFFDSSRASVVRVSTGERGVNAKKKVHYEVRLGDGKVLKATPITEVAHDAAKHLDNKELAKAVKLRRKGKATPDNPESRITSTKSKPGR